MRSRGDPSGPRRLRPATRADLPQVLARLQQLKRQAAAIQVTLYVAEHGPAAGRVWVEAVGPEVSRATTLPLRTAREGFMRALEAGLLLQRPGGPGRGNVAEYACAVPEDPGPHGHEEEILDSQPARAGPDEEKKKAGPVPSDGPRHGLDVRLPQHNRTTQALL